MPNKKGRKWYNNGKIEGCYENCPEGFIPGRLAVSEETRLKHSINNGMKNISKEEMIKRNNKISETKQNKSEEEKIIYSKHLSEAKKGKKRTTPVWNKGKKGVQVAWNKGLKQSEENKKKISETRKNKSEEEKLSISKKLSASLKGREPWNKDKITGPWTDEDKKIILEKQYQTKKKNNSFNISNPENIFKEYLINKYGEENVISQYRDENRYPFNCDFYIKSEDLFIELNLTWTHGGHPFNKDNEEDILLLEYWKQKAETSDYYKNAIYTWTILDIKKQKIAKENKLNYLCIYNLEDYNND